MSLSASVLFEKTKHWDCGEFVKTLRTGSWNYVRTSLKDRVNGDHATLVHFYFLIRFTYFVAALSFSRRFRDHTSLRAHTHPVALDPRLSTLTQGASPAAYAAGSARP